MLCINHAVVSAEHVDESSKPVDQPEFVLILQQP